MDGEACKGNGVMFKEYMTRRFAGCRLIAKSYDEYRKRDVSIFHMPGNFDDVGVWDGCDAWIAPVVADPFRANVKRILEKIRNGESIDVNNPVAKRRALVITDDAPPPRRVVVQESEPESIPRRRHVFSPA